MEKPDSKALRWKARRGMLELDLVLNNFLNGQYDSLPIAEQMAFQKLLENSDPQLYDWLVGGQTPADLNIQKMIEKIVKK